MSKSFKKMNKAFNDVYKVDNLTIGLTLPLQNYKGSVASMSNHMQMAKFIDELGFASLWIRDIPFNVPSFGDAGQLYDPFVYLGFLAAHTKNIALGIGSAILPLRHPAHIAKAAFSIDDLSNSRLLLGVASGDRYEEYPALNKDYISRGDSFRQSFEYIKNIMTKNPTFRNEFGNLDGSLDMLPKPTANLPLLVTGASQQDMPWIAKNCDGWITYPREVSIQKIKAKRFRDVISEVGSYNKPVSQSLYVDITDGDNEIGRASCRERVYAPV